MRRTVGDEKAAQALDELESLETVADVAALYPLLVRDSRA